MYLPTGCDHRTFVLSKETNGGGRKESGSFDPLILKLFMRLYTGNPNAVQKSAAFFFAPTPTELPFFAAIVHPSADLL